LFVRKRAVRLEGQLQAIATLVQKAGEQATRDDESIKAALLALGEESSRVAAVKARLRTVNL
jgi:hypothetical protein